jgi:hypothetical protein
VIALFAMPRPSETGISGAPSNIAQLSKRGEFANGLYTAENLKAMQ